MSFCPKCGKEQVSDAQFCSGCGTALGAAGSGAGTSESKKAGSFMKFGPFIRVVLLIVALIVMYPIVKDMGKSNLEQEVTRSFQEAMLEDDTWGKVWRDNGITVDEVSLIRKGWNEYEGVVEVSFDGKTRSVSISVIKDSGRLRWKTTDFAPFAFLADLYLKGLQDEYEYGD